MCNINKNYVAYHVHTELSLLDSTTNYKDYIHKAKELGQKAICFTEHGNTLDWIEKKKYCESTQYKVYIDNEEPKYISKEEYEKLIDKNQKDIQSGKTKIKVDELKPIKFLHGVEIYLTETLNEKIRDNYHTILIAKTYPEGFRELNKLVDMSTQDDHMYYKPRITFDEFLEISDNVIKISACLASPLNKLKYRIDNLKREIKEIELKMQDKRDNIEDLNKINEIKEKIDRAIRYYERILANYDYYEIQPHINSEEQKKYNLELLELSKDTGIPLIAGTDTHSINKYKGECRTILQFAKNITFSNEDELDLTYKSYEELVDMFKKQGVLHEDVYLKAINNTNIMADNVEHFNLDLSFKYPVLYENEEEVFVKRIEKMYKEKVKIGEIEDNPEYKKRIDEELEVFKEIGMIGFMLFMSELTCWCHDNDIPTGFCRGSVGGSTIAYITDIIDVDPIKWNTVFSRFANKHRKELGDIDLDFAPEDREKVFNHIVESFGKEYTAYILTTGTMVEKGTIDEIVRGFRVRYCKQNGLNPKDKKVKTPYEVSFAKQIKEEYELNPDETKKKYKDIFYYFEGLKGVVISKGIHPAGIVVSPITLADNYGTFWSEGNRVLSINMEEIHDVSLLKYDILGLKNIGIIKDTYKMLGKKYPKAYQINWNDQDVWDSMITSPVGIFQFESLYAFELLKQFKPKMITHMSIVNAALRPSGTSYRDRLINGEKNQNPSKLIDKLLEDNNGYLVFQEDTIKFLTDICGLSGSDADNIRRAIGRKQKDRLMKAMPDILEGYCEKSDKPREIAEEEAKVFLQIIEDSSSYQFGYNHSTGYSMIGYLCALLRYYYPSEFIAAYLNNASNDEDILDGTKLAELKNIKIEPIRFRYSQDKYFVDKNSRAVYKGMSSVKYSNSKIAKELYTLRNNKYNDFLALLIDINRSTSVDNRQLNILIEIGFFKEFGDINKLLYVVELYNELYNKTSIKKDKIEELKRLKLSEDIIRQFSQSETFDDIKEIDYESYLKSVGYSNNELKSALLDCAKYKRKTGEFNGYSFPKIFKKFNITDEQKKQFATKTTVGKFDGIDSYSLIKYMVGSVEIEKCSLPQMVRYQTDYLGYIDIIDETLEWNYVAISDLNTQYSPKFNAYCIKKGKTTEMKVHNKINRKDKNIKTSFNEVPFKDGDVIYIKNFKKQPKKRKVGDDWEVVPDVFEWWIKDYTKVE